jgi:CRISPR-associated protein Csb1
MDYSKLCVAVQSAAAIRRKRRLQPAGGKGDKIFPPTYPSDERGAPPLHVYETRKIGGAEVVCVLIDSVQSQANRLEEALERAAEEGRISLPRLYVDFASTGLNSVPNVSVLTAPHRIFDAILRDSNWNGTAFGASELGQPLKTAKPHDATAILEAAPTALLFGCWNSTGEGGGLGAKFARVIVSEIIGVGVPVEYVLINNRNRSQVYRTIGSREGERAPAVVIIDPGATQMRTAGRRTGSRIDPLGIVRGIDVFKGEAGWSTDQNKAGKGAKKVRPSEINHGNIAPSVAPLGVTCDYAEQTAVITLAGLRRLRFGNNETKNAAARAYLAALGLVALTEADRQGYALRSRCDLVCEGEAPLELVAFDGKTTAIQLDADAAVRLHQEAFAAAQKAGFTLNPSPVPLLPQDKLVEIVKKSQEKALKDEGGPEDESE